MVHNHEIDDQNVIGGAKKEINLEAQLLESEKTILMTYSRYALPTHKVGNRYSTLPYAIHNKL